MIDESRVNARRARGLLATIVVAGALAGTVLGVLIGLAVGAPAVVAVLGAALGVAAGVAIAVRTQRTAPARVLRAIGARPLGDDEEPRLRNLVEGLSLTSGVPVPALYVLEGPDPDGAVLGRNQREAALVFGSGLLASLDRIELEGVVAHLLVRIRTGEIVPATLAASLGPWSDTLAVRLLPSDRITHADLEACQLTRYPPGLTAALEKVATAMSEMTHERHPVPAHLCFAPAGSGRERASHPPLDERIALLREL